MHTILGEERGLILSGQFDRLAALQTRKEAVLLGLRLRPQDAHKIATEISINQRLLSAAKDGVDSARRRLNELAEAQTTLKVYGPRGTSSDVAVGAPGFEQKY
jgi:hypothetical protein